MATAIRFSELKSLRKGDREQALSGLINEAVAPVNGQAFVIKGKIQTYETRYELSSAQLVEGLKENTIKETAEISDWLFWLKVKEFSGIG